MVPISTIFIAINGLIAVSLSSIVAIERARTRVWHGESERDIASQPNPLSNDSPWATFVEKWTQKLLSQRGKHNEILQRKVRAYGNFTEYVPHGLLFIIALELMESPIWIVFFLGSSLTIARIIHAWGVIWIYGPSLGRAIGFFLTLLVYIVGSVACLFYGIEGIVRPI